MNNDNAIAWSNIFNTFIHLASDEYNVESLLDPKRKLDDVIAITNYTMEQMLLPSKDTEKK